MQTLIELTEKARELRQRIDLIKIDQIAPLQNQLNIAEALIGTMVCDLGESVSTKAARLTYVKPSVRTSWDNEGLLQYAKKHPEILDFKRETQIEAAIRIKYNHETI